MSEWKTFFNGYAHKYEEECFTKGTFAEVDFLIEELGLNPGNSILDIGCGTGRHSLEFARRGFHVTGVDFSSEMLQVAKNRAIDEGLNIEFVESPAQDFIPTKKYDAAISLCEGALCLFGSEDNIWGKDMAILANMAEALEPGKPFLITVLNAFKMIRSITDDDIKSGTVDLFTLSQKFAYKGQDSGGQEISISAIERYYTPSEMVRMVNRIGLKVDHLYAGTAGAWKKDHISLDEFEFMLIGHKKNHKGKSV
jgi:SAM-dependent methyltransferase